MTRFLVDAQLPRRLAIALRQQGFDALHTLDLPNGNRTSDAELNLISLDEQRVVVTKDADFVESFLLQGAPFKLLLVSTGNIDNDELLMGLVQEPAGDLVIADTSNDRIRRLARNGQVATLAGQKNWTSLVFHIGEGTTGVVRPDGDEILQRSGESLDWIDYEDGEGTEAKFNNPIGLVIDANGNILIADNRNGRIRRLAPDGAVTSLALRRASRGLKNRWTGEPIRAGKLAQPVGLALGPNGDLFVSEAGLARISRITADGEVHLLAGGPHGFADGPAMSAAFNEPAGLAVDAEGNVYVADARNNRIRRISLDGQVVTIAGGDPGYIDGPGPTARFNEPWGLAFDQAGHLLVTDRRNNVIRQVHLTPVELARLADPTPVKSAEIIVIFSHALDRVVRRKAAPNTPRLTSWNQCVGRRIKIITEGWPDPSIRLYFDDAWIEVEGVGDDPMPYFKDALYDMESHLDASHLVGKTIVRLDLAYGEPGGNCEYVGFTFDDGLRQWLEPHHGSGLRIS